MTQCPLPSFCLTPSLVLGFQHGHESSICPAPTLFLFLMHHPQGHSQYRSLSEVLSSTLPPFYLISTYSDLLQSVPAPILLCISLHCYCNKSPRTHWLQIMSVYYLIVPWVRNSKLVSLGQNQGVGRPLFLSRGSRGEAVACLSSFSRAPTFLSLPPLPPATLGWVLLILRPLWFFFFSASLF